MLHTTAPRQRAYRRPRATRQIRHNQPLPTAIRRGSFMEHAQQFPEVYPTLVAPTTASTTARAAIDQRPRPLRTPRTLLAAAVCFLTARRTA